MKVFSHPGVFLQHHSKIGLILSEENFFEVFTIAIYGGHAFRPINMAWRNVIKGYPRNLLTQLLKRCQTVWEKNNFKVVFVSFPWNSAWIPTIWRTFCKKIKRKLSVKFHPNWPTDYWGEELDGQKAITKTHLEHFVFRWAKNEPAHFFIFLFYWRFTPLSTSFQLYHGDSSLIHDPWVNKPVLG